MENVSIGCDEKFLYVVLCILFIKHWSLYQLSLEIYYNKWTLKSLRWIRKLSFIDRPVYNIL